MAAHAQFTDSFSDGNYNLDPEWSGDVSRFTIVDGKLKLQAPPVSGMALLATASRAIYQSSWEFTIQMDFTPSSANYTKVYLVSDQPAFGSLLNGYFVKIGNTTREVSLYKQTGATEVRIVDGLDDRVNQSSVVVRIRAKRDDIGMWELFSDVGLTGSFVLEGSALDNTHSSSGWFGVQCVYSATRSDKFWFDDFVVSGTLVPDLTPPTILKVEASDPSHLRIYFSEPIASSSFLYERIEIIGIGNPESIVPVDEATVECRLTAPLKNGVSYSMTVYGIEDMAGNSMPTTQVMARYFVPAQPLPKSVLITEIFADPTPQVGLPVVEYVELFNPGPDPFDLHHWQLSDGSTHAVFPEYAMLPGMFLVVTGSAGAGLFGGAKTLALANFPSLNNAGDKLVLSSNLGLPIDSVTYEDSWYGDEDKAAGGWSLELIDPANPCGERHNWTASEDDLGGTPGEYNSVLANKPDLSSPLVVSVVATDAGHIQVSFNELLRSSSIAEAKVELLPKISIEGICMDNSLHGIELTLGESLLLRTPYELRLSGIADCNGNHMESSTFLFGLTEIADSLDVFLSEVLFNPRSGGVDYVEVFNASDKFIQLENWAISNGEREEILPSAQLLPKQWLALTSDPDLLRTQYVSGNLLNAALPSLPDDEGRIMLRTKEGSVLDQLIYQDDWHNKLLQSTEGVALERIDFTVQAQSKDNWVSAAGSSGFGTPGLINSNLRKGYHAASEVTVVPEIFSPGNSSADFIQIQYRFDQPGYVSNVRVYDRQGFQVKELVSNTTLGTEGFLRWDGDRDNGSRAAAGYYVLWFECFRLDGQVETIRRRVILAVH